MTMKLEDQINEIIRSEIGGNYSISNLHGVDLKKCLVEPYLQVFEKSFKEGELVELYVVLKEHPTANDGYQITYNPQEKLFGLGLSGSGKYPLLLGYYDTFLEALEGM